VTDLNPHAKQMADESMVRTLAAQAQAIWPQEQPLFRRYDVGPEPRILDAGCGTGEIASRLAAEFGAATVLGVDIIDDHLEMARRRYPQLASRLRFEHQSIYELQTADATFDLTVCRHVLHSIPHPERVIAELVRVTRPGGWLHMIPEDYGMLHFHRAGLDPRDFWHESTVQFGSATGTDLFVGRHTYGILAALGVSEITVDYVIVDTLRVPREIFARILEAWRDGYVDAVGQTTRFSAAEATAYFGQMLENIRDPRRYAVWMVPVVAARMPARGPASR
jgi:ubiquinone/menaquinone biosynthesis C-methylase UbiE